VFQLQRIDRHFVARRYVLYSFQRSTLTLLWLWILSELQYGQIGLTLLLKNNLEYIDV